MARDHCRRILVAIVPLATHVWQMPHDVVATFSKHIRRHRNLQLFIKLHKEEEKKKKGEKSKTLPPPKQLPLQFWHICASRSRAWAGTRGRERARKRECRKTKPSPKEIVEGGGRGRRGLDGGAHSWATTCCCCRFYCSSSASASLRPPNMHWEKQIAHTS